MKKRKRKIKTAISGYQELLAIKKELKRDITKQEKSIKNDLLNVGKIYRTLRKVLFTKKKKKNTIRNNPATFILSELLVHFMEPYAKSNNQKQILLPVISFGMSYFIVNRLNSISKSLFKRNRSA